MLLDDALDRSTMRKPTCKDEAKQNIQSLKVVLEEVKALRRGSHLSCEETKSLKRDMCPMEDEVKGVLKNLKKESCRLC